MAIDLLGRCRVTILARTSVISFTDADIETLIREREMMIPPTNAMN